MPISKPHSSFASNNTGSSSALANYLEKENMELDRMADKEENMEAKMKIEAMKQQFFSHNRDDVGHSEVISEIDNNKKKLGKDDSKFFAPTLSFSQKELQHLAKKVSGREIKDIRQLKMAEFKAYNKAIQDHARQAMNNYAANFNRQNKGLESGKDLVYFAKVEHTRRHKGTDKEVVDGKTKSGKFKQGLQSHVHIIVSRKDKSQALKLDPTVKDRNTVRTIGGNKYRVGFDRKAWINANEKDFDRQFQYKRQEIEKFQNQNILKNGNPEQKAKLLQAIQKKHEQSKEHGSQNEMEI